MVRGIVTDQRDNSGERRSQVDGASPTAVGDDKMIAAFATPVFLRSHKNVGELNRLLAGTIREMARTMDSDDAFRSHQGGFYSDDSFLHSPQPGVAPLTQLLQKGVGDYIKQLLGAQAPAVQVELAAWVALTRAGDYQAPHVHAGAALSGIYYVEVPDLEDPQGCIDVLSPLVQQEMTFIKGYSKSHCRVCPKPGDLLIFPAYCKHFVHPFQGEGERLCVVFNAVVRQERLGKQRA